MFSQTSSKYRNVFSTYNPSNVPIVATFNGELYFFTNFISSVNITSSVKRILEKLDADIEFTYGPYQWARGENVRVVGSCAATLNNEMYVFGGQFVDRQVNFSFHANRADF